MDWDFKDKKILVTGACGTVGHELVRTLLEKNAGHVSAFDKDETGVFFLENEFAEYANFSVHLGDVRDFDRVASVMFDIDLVFHGAGLKHVIVCERSPFEAVQTNVLGTQNIVKAALHNNVERVIFMSSDKAVNPTSVMGTTKLMGERLITAANSIASNSKTIFACSRFGNVIGSHGSVLTVFAKQIMNGEDVTITDNKMTRFVMTPKQSVRLVIRAMELAHGGEVFVTKMPVVAIPDLASATIDLLSPKYGHAPDSIGLKIIGAKAGEKIHEELMSEEEVNRSLELEEQFVILPAFRGVYSGIDYEYAGETPQKVTKPYRSDLEKSLSTGEIRQFLNENELLEEIKF
ncbi:MAG: polysaccharide biosynthesis protein [Nitrospinaceae bacterium]|jgi:FlaA1/EpsC-like NDP-sugar epimerase|nr:polysaccharide biosynthesis protein [Nitrospinaceae bacterium]MBT3434953.1 polysaccharide biosynthesis protein [Nitrospinaceae bacterium]MBT3819774.1 polysaccharide biosynthesis protein [Nitrospinaceae bacterium]MBT4094295.1 polysaccharide biosynthesis protein [Nitrospinaceae bacterium]MBT4432375.1 polysaccharide biosynthesis protein [Nitrospinaceae bacterium]